MDLLVCNISSWQPRQVKVICRCLILRTDVRPAAHLVVDPEHVSDVDPDVDGIHFVGEGKVELVVVLEKDYYYLRF